MEFKSTTGGPGAMYGTCTVLGPGDVFDIASAMRSAKSRMQKKFYLNRV
jgi:hypothetical protein